MTQEAAPAAAQPEAPAAGALARPRRALGRLGDRLTPRTWRHWAVYASLFVFALFLMYVWRTSVNYPTQVLVLPAPEDGAIEVGLSPYDPERLDFGDLSQGTAGTVNLELENEGRLPMRVTIVATGSIRQFIKISDAFFVVDPGAKKTVDISAAIPPTADPKEYSGRVLVIRTPWFPWP